MSEQRSNALTAVYVQTNDATKNGVLAFERRSGGKLAPLGQFATGGRGTGEAGTLPSQSSIVLSDDGRRLLVVNAAAMSCRCLRSRTTGCASVIASRRVDPDRPASRSAATSSTCSTTAPRISRVSGSTTASSSSWTLGSATERPGPNPLESPSAATAAPRRDRARHRLDQHVRHRRGRLRRGANDDQVVGQDAIRVGFTADGATIVTEAFGGTVGAAAASSYSITDPGKLAPVSGSVADTPQRGVLGGSHQRRPLRLRNQLRRRTISSYTIASDGVLQLRDAVAGSTRLGKKGSRDEAITRDGSYLYAIDADAQKLFGWTVQSNGTLVLIGAFEGVPATVAGLAAS